jgi:hypothetical protein
MAAPAVFTESLADPLLPSQPDHQTQRLVHRLLLGCVPGSLLGFRHQCVIDLDGGTHRRFLHVRDGILRYTLRRRNVPHGMKPCLGFETMAKAPAKPLVVCVDNEGYPASLERRKIYVALRDADAEKHGLLRIIDESGEDYLYPKASFRSIALPQAVKKAVLAA